MGKFHTAYYGVTQSGKTTIARAIARKLSADGHVIVVFDPVGTSTAGGDWPENAIVFDDPEEFMMFLEDDNCPPAHVFVDEAAEIFGHTMRENSWLATRGRHFGIYLHIITQRPKMILPNVRGQIGRAYVFRLSNEDMREIGADFGHSGLNQFSLDTGDFLILNSGSAELARNNVFSLLEPAS